MSNRIGKLEEAISIIHTGLPWEGPISRSWDTAAIERAFAAAAIDASGWSEAMEVTSRSIPCVGAALIPIHTKFASMPCSEGIAELASDYLNAGWASRDERYRGLRALLERGVMSELDFISPEEMARNAYYQEFLVPHGCPWFAGVKVASGNDVRCLTLQRSPEQGAFSPNELSSLAALSRSLSASAALSAALSFARAEGALAAFDATGTGIALLNAQGSVFRLNRAAERLLGKDFSIVEKKLTSSSRKATDQLLKAIGHLLRSGEARALLPPVPFPRSDCELKPLLLYPLRLPSMTSDPFSVCRAAVVISDLAVRNSPPDEVLAVAFNLTRMESAVAREIMKGVTLETAADALCITRETARTHLKSIFAKTQTHRQTELVAILSRVLGLSGIP